MSKNIEIEIRAILTKDEYEKVLSSLSNYTSYSQTNYYLDDSKLSFSNNYHGLRIREKDHKYELTLKQKINNDYLEINQEITAKIKENMVNPGYFPSGEVFDYLTKNNLIDPKNIYIVCKLKTTRIDINYEGTIISLDKNEYFDITDYNIECESINNNEVEKTLTIFLSKFGIQLKKSPITKLEKALSKLKQ